jgi:hypothetical protein
MILPEKEANLQKNCGESQQYRRKWVNLHAETLKPIIDLHS